MQPIKKVSVVLLLLITGFYVSLSKVSAQTILFSENFNNIPNGSTPKDWIIIGDSNWQVLNGEYGIHLSPGLSDTFPSDNIWSGNWNNYIFEVDLRGVEGTDKNVVFRYRGIEDFYEIHHTGGWIYLDRHRPQALGGGYHATNQIYHPLDNNISYHFKIEVNGKHIKVEINQDIIFDFDDNYDPILQGKIGLRVGTGGTPTTEVWYDNVVVTTISTETPTPTPIPTPTPLPSLNVPNIKQYTEPWASQIYDTAPRWSQDPTIKRWGCALTSAVMVLNYYNHTIDPGNLNSWLNTQPDGYIRNGLLNWLAISRYTKLHDSSTSPTLEYKRLTGNQTTLTNEILQNQPPILQEPGHFVVAKNQLPTSFGINDPAYSDRPPI